MSAQKGLWMCAVLELVIGTVFVMIACWTQRVYENKLERMNGTVQGKVLDVIKGWTQGVGGKMTDRFLVYEYTVNGHSYLVKPYVLKNCELNRVYFDTNLRTCIPYIGPHSGSRQTKYHVGERIEIRYDIQKPAEHIIMDDKDRVSLKKGFLIASFISLSIATVLFVISFCVQ